MWETQVLPLGREDPLEEKTATRNPREYSCLGNPMVRGAGGWGRGGGYGPWGCEESDVTNMLMLVTAFIAGCFARCSQMCNELELFFP